ncbi:MAG TPA: MmgE/PrpD family protein [Trebonia sp.]|nr:MmgE/PrpD family protein [Trebonia sp.]
MDRVTDMIASFTDSMGADALGHGILHEAERRLVDSLGCMIGAVSAAPAVIARALAAEERGDFAASVLGLPRAASTAQAAVFANTVMVRYLDFNDTYFGPRGGGGHPSDLIPTALAVGEATGASGTETALLIALGYELMSRLQSTVKLRERGWDQGFYTGLAAAMMSGKALGLSHDQLANAAALAIVPHVPLRVTRAAELSMWKGCATADAARNGVWAARLARRGMTGPRDAFEGEDGVFARVSGPFELELPSRPDHWVISQVHTKYRPAEYNSQALLDLAVEVREDVDLADVSSIEVQTYWLAYSEIGSEPAKWDPQTRETADHSIPFLLARALVDGDITSASFTPERIADPALRPLMAKITVTENRDYSDRFPGELMVRLTMRTSTGTIEREASYPRGHARNPLTDQEIDHKFNDLVSGQPASGRAIADRARSALWDLASVADIGAVTRELRELASNGRGEAS